MKINSILTKLFLLSVFILSISVNLLAQSDADSTVNVDKESGKKEKIKTGWNFGGLPILSFDSDLGLQLGVLGSLYHYGDGSRYPMYNHYIYAEASFYTRGSGVLRLYYDSDKLIKGVRLTADATYNPDLLYAFYGFNGYQSEYNPDWIEDSTRIFYRTQRKFTRLMLSFQGRFLTDKLHWLAGVDYYLINVENVNVKFLNEKKDEEDKIPSEDSMPSLYNRYQQWGLITPEEANGGNYAAIKVGLVYDTRDNEPNPNRGMWSEVVLVGAPKFLSTMQSGFSKISLVHRQYFTIIRDRLTFAYRLGFEATLSGHTPWYAQSRLYPSVLKGSSSEGLGGAKTIRGVLRNRVVGDAIGLGNFEFRWKFLKTIIFNQNIYLALNGFFDTGKVFKEMEEDRIEKLPEDVKKVYFPEEKDSFHNSAGVGLRIVMNQNFIVAVDWGKALDKRDGTSGLYIGLNFLF